LPPAPQFVIQTWPALSIATPLGRLKFDPVRLLKLGVCGRVFPNPIVDCGLLKSNVAAEPKVRDAAVFDEPINSAGVALKVLGNLFQGQNLTERIGGWRSPIVILFHDFLL
jgi:hypothetical protein